MYGNRMRSLLWKRRATTSSVRCLASLLGRRQRWRPQTMADEVDLANDHAEHMLRLGFPLIPAPSFSAAAEFCDDCGSDIPAARRIAVPGCVTCIDCQSLRERRG
ncbi:TraR/DksA C4-type zinc finger protein [Pandoraea sputorum]|uniref:TraR/DksA C4-type zinc finger protein n=1 Tax=Pandoraea sputorum TaxID=93222 RepID=UPI003559368B